MTGPRTIKTRVKTAAKRSLASTLWLERQLNDPFVLAARQQGYRARSAFKLEEVDRRYTLIRTGARVLDLGAAPGSWTQYAAQRGAKVAAIDLLPMQPVAGATILQGDFLDLALQARLAELLDGPADLLLSDVAASSTGQRGVDRLRAEGLAEAVMLYAGQAVRPGGNALIKLVKGAEATLVPLARELFKGYRLLKPAATRADSSEMYLLATDRRATDMG